MHGSKGADVCWALPLPHGRPSHSCDLVKVHCSAVYKEGNKCKLLVVMIIVTVSLWSVQQHVLQGMVYF